MPVKINSLELENVKRIKAVKLEPSTNGLTIVGGKNRQGKTSVLDAIAWALGGDNFKPSNAKNENSVLPPSLKVTLDNGIIVERKGKNSTLKVTDPKGNISGQSLLNSFIEKLALDLPKFMEMTNKEKAQVLLRIIGLEEKVAELEAEEKETYIERHSVGQLAEQKQKFADECAFYPEVPSEPISAYELIQQQQTILAKNGENQRLRQKASQLQGEYELLAERVNKLTQELAETSADLEKKSIELAIATKDSKDLIDESTEELEANIKNIEAINKKINKNKEKERASQEANKLKADYQELTDAIEQIRQEKLDLLKNADLPLKELGIDEGELTYKGQKWDCMSGAEQLKVATSIIQKLNPDCGFVLMDKLEQMDTDTLIEFGDWLSQKGLQVIATRVSVGEECSIIIEDGYVKDEIQEKQFKEFKGEF